MKKLYFGTAGTPFGAKSTEHGIKIVKQMGLDALELEFVYGIYMDKENALRVGKAARTENIILTCHAPYYINLNSLEKAKVKASKQRIIKSAEIASLCNVWSLTFHCGYYMKKEKNYVYEKIKKEIKEIVKELKNKNIKIWIRPETTGKKSQFGNLDEVLKLSQEVEYVMPCIDFAHLHARSGKINTYEEFCEIFNKVESALGKDGLKNIHAHISGIKYNENGERHHLNLKDSDFKIKELIKAFKAYKIKGVIICESPNNGCKNGDAVFIKKLFSSS